MSIPSTGKRFQVYYSQGPAHKNPPQAHEVLYCLQADCIGVENGQTFEEFILSCARAFGALVEMRDEPADAPPESRRASASQAECLDSAHCLEDHCKEKVYRTGLSKILVYRLNQYSFVVKALTVFILARILGRLGGTARLDPVDRAVVSSDVPGRISSART